METIGSQKIWSFLDRTDECAVAKNTAIRNGRGHRVGSYLELATKIAELQFRNRNHVLLFRGQGGDYRNTQGNSSLKPTLFRPKKAGNPNRATLVERFELLARAEQALVEHYRASGFLGIDRLKRHRILRWSILQHYEVCTTPLLDVTHSIRIAASFASLAETDLAFVYVLGVPNLSGAVTASAEAGLQIVRLSSVCPPSAVRPHIQEGYLLGVYPDMSGYEQKELYFHYEMDFGRRLVAKFCFNPASFWKNDNFPKVSKDALYPSEKSDRLYRLALAVKKEVGG
ncbi:FRG domain-containing protein [Bradyrhizobium erythrophlei]|uniref:FRG domain-containing protein n=1 Tax=Bradyrhizobium erythrophlei TaxID=1437360 RepID=UPI0035EDA5FE